MTGARLRLTLEVDDGWEEVEVSAAGGGVGGRAALRALQGRPRRAPGRRGRTAATAVGAGIWATGRGARRAAPPRSARFGSMAHARAQRLLTGDVPRRWRRRSGSWPSAAPSPRAFGAPEVDVAAEELAEEAIRSQSSGLAVPLAGRRRPGGRRARTRPAVRWRPSCSGRAPAWRRRSAGRWSALRPAAAERWRATRSGPPRARVRRGRRDEELPLAREWVPSAPTRSSSWPASRCAEDVAAAFVAVGERAASRGWCWHRARPSGGRWRPGPPRPWVPVWWATPSPSTWWTAAWWRPNRPSRAPWWPTSRAPRTSSWSPSAPGCSLCRPGGDAEPGSYRTQRFLHGVASPDHLEPARRRRRGPGQGRRRDRRGNRGPARGVLEPQPAGRRPGSRAGRHPKGDRQGVGAPSRARWGSPAGASPPASTWHSA